jgi:hypothetical protein
VDGFKKRVKAQRALAFAHILQDYSKLLKRGKKQEEEAARGMSEERIVRF